MIIPDDLKKLITYGDYTLIKEMYDERHAQGDEPDYKTVSEEYVRLVVQEKRTTQRENTAADEIIKLAIRYLEHKRNYREDLLTV